jgi:hypothetical protein
MVLALLLAYGCAPAAAEAIPGTAPSVFLAGANLPRAKALALDAALIKGWRVAVSERDHVVFETRLDTPASAGPPDVTGGRLAPPATTLLRIRADFSTTANGVVTALTAVEVWYAGTPREWTAEVTGQYRANLMNALESLRTQWAGLAPSVPAGHAGAAPSAPRTAPQHASPSTGPAPAAAPLRRDVTAPVAAAAPAPAAAPPATPAAAIVPRPAVPPRTRPDTGAQPIPADDPIGVWAYHAEEFASARGCLLADRGAVLVQELEGAELHEVYCRDGTRVAVRCDRVSCMDGR